MMRNLMACFIVADMALACANAGVQNWWSAAFSFVVAVFILAGELHAERQGGM
jgi:hypothetical protein